MKAFTPENAAWFTPIQTQNTYKFTVTDIISFITKTTTLAPPQPIFPDPNSVSGSSQEKQTQHFNRSKRV